MTRPRILSVSFSPLYRDARVLRQLALLSEHGDVTTVAYGPAPELSARHIEVPEKAASLPETIPGVTRLALRLHRASELRAPGERAVLEETLAAGQFDAVVANDARALPLAFAAAKGAPVWADMHEWAAAENATSLPWRVLVGPYMDHLCREYLHRAAAVTTVGDTLAGLYASEYGIPRPAVVRNASPYRDLDPAPTNGSSIRMVHSGIAVPERNIEALIDAALALDDRFTLDLYLIGKDSYLAKLKARAAGSTRVRFQHPVPTDQLPATLNAYDLGVYILPVKSINHRYMLPNKFFDFVQARIGLVFGPSEETDRLIAEHGIGVVARGWQVQDLVDAVSSLTVDDITRFKANAHAAAHDLSYERDRARQDEIVARLLGRA